MICNALQIPANALRRTMTLFLAGMALVSRIGNGVGSDPKCVAPTRSLQNRDNLVDHIERRVVLPPKADPFSNYVRYYTRGADGKIVAAYFLPVYPEPLENICRFVDSAGLTLQDANPTLLPHVPGERVWVNRPELMPQMNDGGCIFITVRVNDEGANGPIPGRCNGRI